MSEASGIYAIWYREIKVFTREKSRVVTSIVNPIIWLLIFGGGLGSAVSIAGIGYQSFIFPGIIMMSVLFTSVFFGVYIVWDRKVDFLKEVLIAPISRTSVFVGKVLGGSTDSTIQVVLILSIGFCLSLAGVINGVSFSAPSLACAIAIAYMTTVGMVSIGLIIGSVMESPQGFQMVSSFLIFPLFLLSGALFPLDNLPSWLAPLNMLDPLTYAVDAMRWALLGTSHFGILTDVAVFICFDAVAIIAGTYAFKKMKV
jgi:ABC-2 type transport system permease protein